MAEAGASFSITERPRDRASRWSAKWRGSVPGGVILVVVPTVCAGITTLVLTQHIWTVRRGKHVRHDHWPVAAQVLIPIGVFVLALGLIIAVVHANYLIKAPHVLLAESRQRHVDVRDAAHRYSIVPTQVVTIDSRVGTALLVKSVKIEVLNDGREGRFAATIDSVSGFCALLVNPHRNLFWEGREASSELIPSGATRLIGAISIWAPLGDDEMPTSLNFAELDIYGVRGQRATQLMPGDRAGEAVVWVRIAALEGGEFGYTRMVGIRIQWDGPGSDPWVDLYPPMAENITETFAPSVTHLLDY